MGLGGTIEGGGGNINSLGGVDITSPTNGQILTYDSVSGNWVNSNGSGPTGYQTIQGQGTAVAQETKLNFATTGFIVADDPAHLRTDVSLAQSLIDIAGLTPTLDSIIYGNGMNFVNNPLTQQQTIYVALNGSDTTGNGSILFPYASIYKANSVITDAANLKKYTVVLLGGRFNEAQNILLKPFVAYCGFGSSFTYITSPNNIIAPDPSHNAANSRTSMMNIYVGGSTGIDWDLTPYTGAQSCVLDLVNIQMNGGLTYLGRSNGSDFLQTEESYWIGATQISNTQITISGGWCGNTFTLDTANNAGHVLGNIINFNFGGNVTIASTAGVQNSITIQTTGIAPNTLTITGATTALAIDAVSLPSLQSNLTISGGATISYITNCYGIAYNPATSGNWSTPPSVVNTALDDIAATGITGTFTAGSVLFSNGTKVTQDNANFFWDDTGDALKLRTGYTYQFGTLDAFSRTQIWNFDTNAILRLGSLGADGDPTTTSSQGIVVYGPAVNGSMAPGNWGIGRIKVDRLGLLSNVPGGLQDYYFRADPNGMFLQSDASVKTFNVDRNSGTITTSLSAYSTLTTDGSSNITAIASSNVGYVLTSNGISAAPTFQPSASVGMTWTAPATSETMAANNGYFTRGLSLVTLTLPATAAGGDTYIISNTTAAGFQIAQNAGQTIRFGVDTTTTGAGGYLSSNNLGDTVTIVCSVANTSFQVTSSVGNITIV